MLIEPAKTKGDRERADKLCELQEKYLEQIPKQMDSGDFGAVLEADMDILRELACRKYPDWGYIDQKIRLMCRSLERLGLPVSACKEIK